jgi:hypothetical protein
LQSHFKVLACSNIYAGYLLALLLSMLLVPTPILLLLLLLLLDAGHCYRYQGRLYQCSRPTNSPMHP